MKTLCVFGYKVAAPKCPVCGKDDDVVVKVHEDGGWVYCCDSCQHELTFDELMRQEKTLIG